MPTNYGYFYRMNTSAFLFDLNGTMIDDMYYHIKAWHGIMNRLGAEISLEKMKEECYGKNEELLERIFPGRFNQTEKLQLGTEKETKYRADYKAELRLLPGLQTFLEKAKWEGIKMVIGSAAIMDNIDFVLDGLNIRHYFYAIVSADHVEQSKPNPETYLKCVEFLQLDKRDCIVFEDTPKGVETARNAGLHAVVINTMHTPTEFENYPNIKGFAKDYTNIESTLLKEFFQQKEYDGIAPVIQHPSPKSNYTSQ